MLTGSKSQTVSHVRKNLFLISKTVKLFGVVCEKKWSFQNVFPPSSRRCSTLRKMDSQRRVSRTFWVAGKKRGGGKTAKINYINRVRNSSQVMERLTSHTAKDAVFLGQLGPTFNKCDITGFLKLLCSINSFNQSYLFSFPTQNDTAFILFVNILFSYKYVFLSQHSIISNKVDIS